MGWGRTRPGRHVDLEQLPKVIVQRVVRSMPDPPSDAWIELATQTASQLARTSSSGDQQVLSLVNADAYGVEAAAGEHSYGAK